MPRPEQRSGRDILATLLILALALLAVGGCWWYSQARDVEHELASTPAPASAPPATAVPEQLRALWEAPDSSARLTTTTSGVLTVADNRAVLRDPEGGRQVWSYRRERPICGTAADWERVVLIFRSPKGCSEGLSFAAGTGQYAHSRDALGSPEVSVFSSNNHVGLISPRRVELWRSDLVRTTEVGSQEAPAQPGQQQPHGECEFTSAATRKQLLATVQQCPGQQDKLVRLLHAVPEKADVPEKYHEFTVPGGSELVAIGQDKAVIYVPGNGIRARDAEDAVGSRFQILGEDGRFSQVPADPSSVGAQGGLRQPWTADLPHHMTWWDGSRLVAFQPGSMEPVFSVPGAIGIGDAMAERLLVPVAGGLAVVDWSTGAVERAIPVDRSGYAGPVELKVVNNVIVEKRGDRVVALA
ncbi:hypothetical protein DLJ54_09595 [Corynebacterium heidelbergense]|uniref:PQQ-binding-like beta-propeller repeat protein n=1 Tax=Corynebacterium heidelbergense TaxID=2055947 RepID=A0A364V3M0_9CORY|nr:hypothetical protein DLJ54_09595 [Corynebacterium heidelbergense]